VKDPFAASSLPDLAWRSVESRPGAVAFLVPWEDGFRPVTAREWWEDIEKVAAALRAVGVGRGDRVLLMMETRYEWLVCDLAILSCGARTVPAYPNLPSGQLIHPIEDASPRAVIVARSEQASRVLGSGPAARSIPALFILDQRPGVDPGAEVRSLREILDGPAVDEAERTAQRFIREGLAPEEPATIIYTSGTSSTPKGVVLTHANVIGNARSIQATLPFGPTDRHLSVLPLAHTLERTATYTMLAAGVSIAYARGIEVLARDAALVRPTFLLAVPRLFESILAGMRATARSRGALVSWLFRLAEDAAIRRGGRGPAEWVGRDGARRPPKGLDRLWDKLFFETLRERLGGQIRFVVSGSAPLGIQEALFFTGAGIPMLEGYGLTEAGPVVSVNTFASWEPGTVGRPLAGVEVRISEEGEILVRSPGVMTGYWNNDADTRDALEGGWLHTGDLGTIGVEGRITIAGRKKDLIVTSGGKNISPQPIEECLRGSPFIQEAVVFGDRRPFLVALIVADRQAIVSELGEGALDPRRRADVRTLLRGEVRRLTSELAPHERIRNFDLLETPPSVEAGTLTPTLKVRRSALESQNAERIAALYEGRR
jgi:long-chain acyl-CoA synthetase